MYVFKLITGKPKSNQARGKGTKRQITTVENDTAKKLQK